MNSVPDPMFRTDGLRGRIKDLLHSDVNRVVVCGELFDDWKQTLDLVTPLPERFGIREPAGSQNEWIEQHESQVGIGSASGIKNEPVIGSWTTVNTSPTPPLSNSRSSALGFASCSKRAGVFPPVRRKPFAFRSAGTTIRTGTR